ncbi:MAG: HupE/UreJ family protein [Pirellulales bacterium]
MKHATKLRLITFVVFASLSATAFGHPGHSHEVAVGGGLLAGFLHPLLGLDHLLAMVTVGLLSAQLGGRARWAIPGSFLACMMLGGLLGMNGFAFAGIEYGIAASLVVLGLAVAFRRSLHLAIPMAMAGLFGAFHGHAHGTEMPHIASPALYAAGFVVATLGLHVCGLVVGSLTIHSARGVIAVRVAGAAIALAGIWFVLSI